jgi:hypothetical protein
MGFLLKKAGAWCAKPGPAATGGQCGGKPPAKTLSLLDWLPRFSQPDLPTNPVGCISGESVIALPSVGVLNPRIVPRFLNIAADSFRSILGAP